MPAPGLWSLAGGWQHDDHTTLRHDHESWSFKLWTAVNSPVWCGPSSYIQIRAQSGSEVVISTLGLSLQALSLCSFNLSQQNHVYQWSIHCSIHITPKLTEINTFNKYGHGCSSVSESLSRLPTVGNVVLWPHHPDIAPVWPPMRDPCPPSCSAVPPLHPGFRLGGESQESEATIMRLICCWLLGRFCVRAPKIIPTYLESFPGCRSVFLSSLPLGILKQDIDEFERYLYLVLVYIRYLENLISNIIVCLDFLETWLL